MVNFTIKKSEYGAEIRIVEIEKEFLATTNDKIFQPFFATKLKAIRTELALLCCCKALGRDLLLPLSAE